MKLPIEIDLVKGFLDHAEGMRLHDLALEAAKLGPVLEVGSYCGKSTVYLGMACQQVNSQLYAIDHHRGSEEHQKGEEYHDPDLYDSGVGKMDSFREFRITMERAELTETVVPLVASSAQASRYWSMPLSMVFIDGGHSMEAAMTDYRAWAGHVVPGGILAIHDVFPNPEDGGRAPFTIWELAKASGLYTDEGLTKTLGVLRRR